MSSRDKITKFCKDNDIKLIELHYIREFVPVPEEMVPVGWYVLAALESNHDDVFEFYGDVDDIISQLKSIVDDSNWYMSYGQWD